MGESIGKNWSNFYNQNILKLFQNLRENPFNLFTTILDIIIVIFLLYCFFRIVKESRAWQLIKGIALLIVATWLSSFFNLRILNSILTGIMNWGVIAIIVIFQPELRRALEQLGTNKIVKLFGINSDLATKTKEDIYKVVIAAKELSNSKTGALIVIERDINIQDIISTGVPMNSEVSPQLLAACVLPLADDPDIAKEIGTRHRAAIGISKESDSIAVVVSEETGKISVAKDGTLIADVREDTLKKILISNIVTKRFADKKTVKNSKFSSFKQKIKQGKDKKIHENSDNKSEN